MGNTPVLSDVSCQPFTAHLIAVMQLYMLCLSEVLSTSLSLSPTKHSSTLPDSLVSLKKSFW